MAPETRSAAASRVKGLARAAGFPLVRISRAEVLEEERDRYVAWIEDGRHGEMAWITKERADRSSDPSGVLSGAVSIVSVGLPYWSGPRPALRPNRGRLARYSWGADYHLVISERLKNLAHTLGVEWGGEHRWHVDTGPLMDKALSVRSGLGWYGRNTNVLTEQFGSFILLGEIVTTLDLQPDLPLNRSCGTCRLCVTACPTGALDGNYSIDSRRCISYLTIELRGPIPRDLRPLMGSWVFGCDICQDVCPPTAGPHLQSTGDRHLWTAHVRDVLRREHRPAEAEWGERGRTEAGPLFADPPRKDVDLVWLLHLSHAEYLEAFRGTAIKRAKVWMLRRNAAVALGNVGDAGAIPALARALREDEVPLVRGHAAWALGRLGTRLGIDVAPCLSEAREPEKDDDVREEIDHSLAMLEG